MKRVIALMLAFVVFVTSVKPAPVDAAAEAMVYSSLEVLEWVYSLGNTFYVPPEYMQGASDVAALAESPTVVSLLTQFGEFYENAAKDPVLGVLPVPTWESILADLKAGKQVAEDVYDVIAKGYSDFYDKIVGTAVDYSMPADIVDTHGEILETISPGDHFVLMTYQAVPPDGAWTSLYINVGSSLLFLNIGTDRYYSYEYKYDNLSGQKTYIKSASGLGSVIFDMSRNFTGITSSDLVAGSYKAVAGNHPSNAKDLKNIISSFKVVGNYIGLDDDSFDNVKLPLSDSGKYTDVSSYSPDVLTPHGVPSLGADLPALRIPSLAPDIPQLDIIKELLQKVASPVQDGAQTGVAGGYTYVDDEDAIGAAVQEYLDSLAHEKEGEGEGEGEIEKETTAPGENESEKESEKEPDNESYTTPGLESVFPFCIPFDLIDCFKLFSAPAKAPRFEWNFKVDRFGINETIVIDLAPFEPVAVIFRTLMIIAFVIGLIMITRNLIGS